MNNFSGLWAIRLISIVPGPEVIYGRGLTSGTGGASEEEMGGGMDSGLASLHIKCMFVSSGN